MTALLKLFVGLILIACSFTSHLKASTTQLEPHGNAVSYTFSGGRFGDNLIAYLHAKWISYKYDLPLLYVPFQYSNDLQMGALEPFSYDALTKNFHQITLKQESDGALAPNNTLLIVPYFPESLIDFQLFDLSWLPYYPVDWKDPGFLHEVRTMISPRHAIQTVKPPTMDNTVSVALHMRTGKGVESSNAYLLFPLKIPPESYYVEALYRLTELFPNKQRFYVYLFTDDPNPKKCMKRLNKTFGKRYITFECRPDSNAGVLEDFFSLLNFDCLIRTESNFSIVAEKLKNFKVVIAPKHHTVKNKVVTIDQFDIIRNP